MKEEKFVASPVNVLLRNTDVVKLLLFLLILIPRKLRVLFFSVSLVNLMAGCCLLRYSTKGAICDLSLNKRKVSSANLL